MREAQALALAAGILLATTPSARAQVSPGPLARAHADLEGSLKCFNCHGPDARAMDGKCLACHDDIAWLKDRGCGIHGRSGLGACASCHPDHAGAGFELIHWEDGGQDQFDHRRSGWALSGRHATIDCRRCHQPRYQVSEAARLGRHKDASRSWVGLDPECRACHEDVHAGALGEDCARCHDENAWKPAAAFDHAKTTYPLQGKHATVPCAGCHLAQHLPLRPDAQGRPIALYKPVPHDECSACHRDPHQSRLGPSCGRCHGFDDFRRVAAGAFDHERTRYPLRDAHGTVACARCHDPASAWGPRPAFGTCAACHHDPHAGEATLAGAKADCAACHSMDRFRPSTFTVAQHAASGYPLEGRHRNVPCASCHTKAASDAERAASGGVGNRRGGERGGDLAATSGEEPARGPRAGVTPVRIRMAHARCTDCHADAHGGQIAPRADGGACEPCHGVEGWKPARFTAADHATLRLPLLGRHAKIACAACHGPERPGLPPLPEARTLGPARVALRTRETACADCHRDPHGGRFKGETAHSGAASSGASPPRASLDASACVDCHDASAFRPSRVDVDAHGRFSYRLEGAHRALPCDACHEELRGRPAAGSLILAVAPGTPLEFRQERSRCADCHRTPHGDQFAARSRGGDCAACHGIDRFAPAPLFDHDRDSAFPLRGAHAKVACARCHVARSGPGQTRQVVYRPLTTRCEDCHRGGTSGAGQPVSGSASTPPT